MAWIVFVVVAVVVVGLILFLIWASADVRSGIYIGMLCRIHTERRVVALTFDDGPDEKMTPRVLDILKYFGVRATFFVVGKRAAEYPDLVRRMVREGHTVANHTATHPATLPLKRSRAIVEEIEYTRTMVERLTNLRMRLFRPPFGVTNPNVARAVRQTGVVSVGWSIRSLDSVPGDRQRVLDRIVRHLHPGGVVLLHDRLDGADWLLVYLIKELQKRNYTTVTVDELFEIEAYEK